MTSIQEQKQITHDCFNQNVPRDCEKCPAHYTEDGICCFGDPEQHDPETPDCERCVFFDDCADVVDAELRAEEEAEIEREAIRQNNSRFISNGRTVVPRSTISVSNRTIARRVPDYIRRRRLEEAKVRMVEREQGGGNLVQIKHRDRIITPPSARASLMNADLAPGETLFNRFLKDSVWGGFQGLFEAGAEFFRSHRLP